MKKKTLIIVVALLVIGGLYVSYRIANVKIIQVNADDIFDSYSEQSSPEGKRAAFFNFLVDGIRDAYCGIYYKEDYYGYKWSEITEYYRPKVLSVESDAEFIFLCREMLSLLDDGHTNIALPSTKEQEYDKLNQSLPIGIEKREDGFYLYSFNQTLVTKLDKVDINDKLIKIDGKEIEDVYNTLLDKTIFGKYDKTESLLVKRLFRTYYYYLKRTENPVTANLVFEKENGETYELELAWRITFGYHNMYGVITKSQKKVGLQAKKIDNTNIGYIKIDKWDYKYREKFEEEFEKLQDTDAIIIDVRNNPGGDFTGYGQAVLSKFLDKKTTTLYKVFRDSDLYHIYGSKGLHYHSMPKIIGEFYSKVPIERMPAKNTYDNPVVLLTNEFHFSSNDLFITAFKDLGLGKIVGRLNAFQSFGQPIHIKTPWNGWQINMSVMIPYSPNGEMTEDRIIEPDIYVPLTEEEIAGKDDPILNSAIEYLKTIISY